MSQPFVICTLPCPELILQKKQITDENTKAGDFQGRAGESLISSCLVCGDTFIGKPHNANKFCSYACYHSHRWPPSERKFIKVDGVWYKGRCDDCEVPIRNQYSETCRPCLLKRIAGRKRNYAGARHWNWKGGITDANHQVRTSTEMRMWRKAVFERDNYTCQNCGQYGGPLQADHIKPFATHHELRFDVDNGRTLCKPCHLKTPTWGRKALAYAN